MVCLAVGGGPTARVDLPRSPEEMRGLLEVLTDTYLRRHPSRHVVLVAYGEDREQCQQALMKLRDALVDTRPGGPRVGPALWVDGDEWVDLLSGDHGRLDQSAREQFDFDFTLMGRARPAGSRADLTADLQGDPTPVSIHLTDATQRAASMDTDAFAKEVEWLGTRIDTFLQDRTAVSEADAARVLAAMAHPEARNAAESRITRSSALIHSEFWHDLVRRAPAEVRNTPAALLALSCYMDGRGAHAWTALDQICGHDTLGDLVAAAIEQVVNPRELERMLHAYSRVSLLQQAALSERPAPHRAADLTRPAGTGVDPDASAPGR